MKPVVVFDGYGTLWGAVKGEWDSVRLRPHAHEVLHQLAQQYNLVLWTTASRRQLDVVLANFSGLEGYFTRIVSRDDVPLESQAFLAGRQQRGRISKDISLVGGQVLVDDSEDAVAEAEAFGFSLVRAPSILFDGPQGRDALEQDQWLPELPQLIQQALAGRPSAGILPRKDGPDSRGLQLPQ